jgi:hypothetical protein
MLGFSALAEVALAEVPGFLAVPPIPPIVVPGGDFYIDTCLIKRDDHPRYIYKRIDQP